MIEARTYYHPRERVVFECVGEGRTRQEFKEECDINNIMKRYERTGVVPQFMEGTFGDFTQVGDFLDCQLRVKQAEQHFSELPSKVRDRFGGSVEKLLAFMSDVKNKDEAIALGLIPKPVEVKVEAEPIVRKKKVEKKE